MKTSPLATPFALFGLMIALVSGGCSAPSGSDDHCKSALYDGKHMEAYVDTVHDFHLCIPQHLTRTGSSTGRVVFSGFSVPPGTTLVSKSFVVAPGTDDDVQGATAFGHLTAGGVTFQRARLDEGSAGHSTLHLTYIWTAADGQKVFFDFTHYAVNPLVYDPADRPANYDQAAQIKLTEEIMSTFVRLH